MRLTNTMMTNTSLMHINRNMRNFDRITRSIETGRRIQRPSDDPIIAARALLFRTSVHETEQFQRNVNQGLSWMTMSETTFNNINGDLMLELRNLATRGANFDNNLDNMLSYARQMQSLFSQITHEINGTMGGAYLFSGFRTNEPPVFTEPNTRSFVITQHFTQSDIGREMSFQRIERPGRLGIPEPVTHNIHVLKLAYTGLDSVPVVPGFDVRQMSVTDADAYTPPAMSDDVPPRPVLHFVAETGELVMHAETSANFPREGISVTFRKTGFAAGDLNPMVYFTGREIVDTSTGHIRPGTQLVYNITQYFNREASIGPSTVGGVPMLLFELEFTPYNPTGGLPANLRASLPPGAVLTGSVLQIPEAFFNTNRNVSVTYPVAVGGANPSARVSDGTVLNSPMMPNPDGGMPIHIKENTRVAGVELVRALDADGRALRLEEMERNVSIDMHHQEMHYEFAARTTIAINSLAKNVLTDKMFADFRRFFEFSESLIISDRDELMRHFRSMGYPEASIEGLATDQINRESQKAREGMHRHFNNMLLLIDRHSSNSMREQTELGARMMRLELIENRLEQDYVSYNLLVSDNENTDLILANTKRMSAMALLNASIMANANALQLSLANFLR